jgi:hypothetical protein
VAGARGGHVGLRLLGVEPPELVLDGRQAALVAGQQGLVVASLEVTGRKLGSEIGERADEEVALVLQPPPPVITRARVGVLPGSGHRATSGAHDPARNLLSARWRRQNSTPIAPTASTAPTDGRIQTSAPSPVAGGDRRMDGP